MLSFSGCNRSCGAVWEDTKTVGRHLHRKGRLLWNGELDSRMIANSGQFQGPEEEDFIPLKEEDLKIQYAQENFAQPKLDPGTQGSGIPTIDQFKSPSSKLASIFKNLYFKTDEHILRNKSDYHVVAEIATYLKSNQNVYVFVAGHCDERGSESYNLALGTRRSNTIRNLLIKRGVSPNQVYTISFGKEMPSDISHTPEAWKKNRRVEYKIFKKTP